MTTYEQTFTIGVLAERSGVPVKTIRFYSDRGVLPPSSVTATGYRRYTESDLVRLETIRTLRAAGFDLETIGGMLDRALDPVEAARLQIEALAVQERTIRRQRLMLERAIANGETSVHPERARALALLSSAERASFLRGHLQRGVEGVRVDERWWRDFLDVAVEGVPDELSDEQLAAWIELAEMTANPSFAEAIRRTAQPFWDQVGAVNEAATSTWQKEQGALVERAREARRAGLSPESDVAGEVVDAWLTSTARLMGREREPAFDRWFLDHAHQTHDPRLARYWELMGVLKGWAVDRELNDVWAWIVAALWHRYELPAP